jgi:multiple sugar transport system permease protein
VVSGVALAVLWRQIFNNDYGLMNAFLRKVITPPDWLGRDAAGWAIPAFVIMGLWGVGGGMIIYLAGLKGIPTSLYEAATIDGASAPRRFWNVTLPMLSPLIFYNFVMGIIGSFQVFTQAMVMTGGGPNNATLFYVLNLYRQAFQFHQMGYASALAWVLFVIVLGLTILVFRGSKNLVYYEGLKT